jgi:hypothetical protein
MALLEWEKWQNGSSFRWRNIAISLIFRLLDGWTGCGPNRKQSKFECNRLLTATMP